MMKTRNFTIILHGCKGQPKHLKPSNNEVKEMVRLVFIINTNKSDISTKDRLQAQAKLAVEINKFLYNNGIGYDSDNLNKIVLVDSELSIPLIEFDYKYWTIGW